MDRREFLRRALSLAPAAIILPPAVSYFLAPRGGWPSWASALSYTVGDRVSSEGVDYLVRAAERARKVWEEAYADMMVYGSSVIRANVILSQETGARVMLSRIEPRDWTRLEV